MLRPRAKRAYIDTSVFGGYFDPEFERATRLFFEHVRSGTFTLLISPVTLAELVRAPANVVDLLNMIPDHAQELLREDDRVEALRDAYLDAKVVSPKSKGDAEHIAWASVAAADFIVSWNFKHIVQVDRIRGYHSVNLRLGFALVPIHSPMEVLPYAE